MGHCALSVTCSCWWCGPVGAGTKPLGSCCDAAVMKLPPVMWGGPWFQEQLCLCCFLHEASSLCWVSPIWPQAKRWTDFSESFFLSKNSAMFSYQWQQVWGLTTSVCKSDTSPTVLSLGTSQFASGLSSSVANCPVEGNHTVPRHWLHALCLIPYSSRPEVTLQRQCTQHGRLWMFCSSLFSSVLVVLQEHLGFCLF